MHLVTRVTLDTTITVLNLYITTQLIIYGNPPIIHIITIQNLKANWKWNPSLHLDMYFYKYIQNLRIHIKSNNMEWY